MLDPLARLRDETSRELDAEAHELPMGPASEALGRLLAGYFAEREESDVFLQALELLADREAGAYVEPRRVPVPQPHAIAASVEQALGRTGRDLQRGLMRHLGLTEEGAAMLAERPAAALSRHPAPKIAALADWCGASRGRVLRAIAASARDGGQYVYAYRPGSDLATPAARVVDGDDILAWGRALIEAPNEED